jgi:ABC-type nitrate/sulfonate/bicarbonate transport system substrate-binding protein
MPDTTNPEPGPHPRARRKRRFPTAAFAAFALGLVACCARSQAPSGPSGSRPVRLILDFLPNAVHVGFYQAEAAGYYSAEGIDLGIEPPTNTSDTLRLMAAGQADLGIVSLLDFLNERAKGEPLKIVMAVEQRPLGAIFCLRKSGIHRPRDLAGRLVSITGVLSDEAGVKWLVRRDGADPASVRLINVGFNTAQEVIAGNVDAAFGFWNQDAVQVSQRQPAEVLRLDAYGAPAYPELVLFAREDTLLREPGMVRAFLRATVRGYADALARPDDALAAMATRVEGETVPGLRPYFDAVRPVLQADAPAYGRVNLAVLRSYLDWVRETGVLDFRADPSTFATNAYLPGAASER